MTEQRANLIENGVLRFERLKALRQKPPVFEPGEPKFWDDPHISQQLLQAHLDPDVDAASRRPEIIDQTVDWIVERLELVAGDTLLDLGCGPGLYGKRWAKYGLRVTGVDISPASIEYARQHDPAGEYLCQNYLTLDFREAFQAITLIYGDFCALRDEDRDRLLGIVHRALLPGGMFVFDVSTRLYHERSNAGVGWSALDGPGFWKPGPHLVLANTYLYPECDTALDQYLIVEADGTISVYRHWFHYYSVASITAVLARNGFEVVEVCGDLTGAPYTPDSEWIGVVAQHG